MHYSQPSAPSPESFLTLRSLQEFLPKEIWSAVMRASAQIQDIVVRATGLETATKASESGPLHKTDFFRVFAPAFETLYITSSEGMATCRALGDEIFEANLQAIRDSALRYRDSLIDLWVATHDKPGSHRELRRQRNAVTTARIRFQECYGEFLVEAQLRRVPSELSVDEIVSKDYQAPPQEG